MQIESKQEVAQLTTLCEAENTVTTDSYKQHESFTVHFKVKLRKSITRGSNLFLFRKIYTGEIRELLDESILMRATN